MTHRRIYSFWLVASLALLLGGCVESEQPLSALADAKPDPRLVGTWRSQSDNSARVTFDEHGIGYFRDLVFNGAPKQDGALTFFVTQTAQNLCG